jgi:hypothetical protein
VKMLDGNSAVAVGLNGAPAVRARASASLMPLSCSESGTIAVSLLRSKYGPGANAGRFGLFKLLYMLALGNCESVIG